jgi:alkanesulfonate monooxygenase SsuD/methylene tetrahydromethanopterin reductase-like flavin-dependent oxidoreductase (luciferase family)
MPEIMLRYDFRNPEFATTTAAEQYAACLRQCAWAEEHGIDSVVLSEHHGLSDGFLPAPLTAAAAIAGRTHSLRITVAALLVPLYDPISLAEQLAVLDLVSGGRVRIVAGLGYRDEEFAMFGASRSTRSQDTEDRLRVLVKAWQGKPFDYRGGQVLVTPVPERAPHELVMVGGSSEIAARRAARLRLGFYPALPDPALAQRYEEACAAEGFTAGFVELPPTMGFLHVTHDPERAWQQIARHAIYEAVTYSSAKPPGEHSAMEVDGETLAEVKNSGVYRVVTPAECVELAGKLGPSGKLVLHPLMGGLPPELGWESLELFAAEVLPKLTR